MAATRAAATNKYATVVNIVAALVAAKIVGNQEGTYKNVSVVHVAAPLVGAIFSTPG
jgi:hypothetical protein